MVPVHEVQRRGRSGFVAAFLSLLFPGLGHAYLGAYRRGLGFAAPPILLGALIAGIGVRLSAIDLAGMAVQTWFLTGLFIANLIALAYRAAAIVDAWAIARDVGPVRSPASGSMLRAANGLSIAGLAGVLLIMSVAHVAVAKYDLLLAGTEACVFDANATGCGSPEGSPAPGDTSAPSAAPGSAGPVSSAPAIQQWDGKQPLNILLIGVDEQQGGHNTDTMITASIDPKTKQVVLFTIPRDTVDVPIPADEPVARQVFGSTYAGKINSWWSTAKANPRLFPGSDATRPYTALKDIIGNLYGIPISYYVEVNFTGFVKVVDALGGVTVNVQVPVLDDNYPLARGDLQRLYIPAGLQHMDGSDALQYSRSRHGSTDFDRGARQQRVLVSLRRETDIAQLVPQLDTLTAALKSSVRTDIPRELVPRLLGLAQGVDTRSFRSVIFTPPFYQTEFLNSPRGYIIEPNISRIRAAVREAFTVDPNAAAARDAIAQEGATVWVLNGTSQFGEATRVAEYLTYLGMSATAPNQRPDVKGLGATTIRVYNGASDKVPLTIAALKQVFGVEPVLVNDPAVHVDIVVIIGTSTPQLTPPPVP
jgi:polyisoprenyl-teichoic acid--peptidoglycan teichoic acid transferase